MHQLLTKGMGHTRFRRTEIGEIPEEWETVRVEETCTSIRKGIFDIHPSNYVEQGIPLLRISNIVEGEVDLTAAAYISEEMHQRERKTELMPGDIVISKVGSLNRIAAVPEGIPRCNISQNMIGCKLDRSIFEPQFFVHMLSSSRVARKLIGSSNVTTLSAIRLDAIRKLLIPVPTLNEQRQIVEILSAIGEKAETERKRHACLCELKKGLMDDLLTGKVRFKVN